MIYKLYVFLLLLLFFFCGNVYALEIITIQVENIDEAATHYRIYQRKENEEYNYENYIEVDAQYPTVEIELDEEGTYFFVGRVYSYELDMISPDSEEEISYTYEKPNEPEDPETEPSENIPINPSNNGSSGGCFINIIMD